MTEQFKQQLFQTATELADPKSTKEILKHYHVLLAGVEEQKPVSNVTTHSDGSASLRDSNTSKGNVMMFMGELKQCDRNNPFSVFNIPKCRGGWTTFNSQEDIDKQGYRYPSNTDWSDNPYTDPGMRTAYKRGQEEADTIISKMPWLLNRSYTVESTPTAYTKFIETYGKHLKNADTQIIERDESVQIINKKTGNVLTITFK